MKKPLIKDNKVLIINDKVLIMPDAPAPTQHSIILTLIGVTADASNPTTIADSETKVLYFYPEADKELPAAVYVTGARSYTWEEEEY